MKLILSRKGFDAGYGGVPSPIFPDGRVLSLPIPAENERVTFGDMTFDEEPVGVLVEQLSNGKVTSSDTAHLDPDLNRGLVARGTEWLPAFGQAHRAQSHLANQLVGPGDLFLFYGWFREVERDRGLWRYVRNAPDVHMIFGWLRVDEVLNIGSDIDSTVARYPGLKGHPHCCGDSFYTNNTIYVGSDAGTFRKMSNHHILTAPNETRSVWRLPRAFSPNGRVPMTYHRDSQRWSVYEDGYVRLQTVAKGQEFVLDLEEYPDVHGWIDDVMGSKREPS